MAGRPATPINWELVEEMAEAHCTGAAIARALKINPRSLTSGIRRKYNIDTTDYLHERQEFGDSNIKVIMYRKALKGDTTMLIWYSKNVLGWSDKSTVENLGLPPAINIQMINADPARAKLIEEFFNNGKLNESIPAELGSVPEPERAEVNN